MKHLRRYLLWLLPLLILCVGAVPGHAQPLPDWCPPDTDGVDTDGDGDAANDNVCISLAAGDGFVNMGDAAITGAPTYTFGFSDTPIGWTTAQVVANRQRAAQWPGPTIVVREGQNLYLRLTNVGLAERPDLFDPHSVHYHGFPNAASIFDGLPESGPTVNMSASFVYFYHNYRPGQYFYHCHVEATEHMQMGMIGNLWVTPKQNFKPDGFVFPNGFVHRSGYKYAYNDNDGSTYYDKEYPVQLTGFDPRFHEADHTFQLLPFADLYDDYPMINGRGYPDTINPNALGPDPANPSQRISSLITAKAGEKILLRLNSVGTVDIYTIRVLGIPMKIVGRGGMLLRGTFGNNLYQTTNAINVAGGEAYDVILDTTGVAPGTYFLYTTNYNHLVNADMERGGMMTEIVVTPGPV